MLFQKSQNYITKGKAWVHSTLDPLRSCHASSFVPFLYTCRDLNGSSTTVHWTQAAPHYKKVALQIHYH